jgi:hypothetical protein
VRVPTYTVYVHAYTDGVVEIEGPKSKTDRTDPYVLSSPQRIRSHLPPIPDAPPPLVVPRIPDVPPPLVVVPANADHIRHNHALSKLRLGPLHRVLTRAPPFRP